jgi:predicted AAA+ superfamily ATPase
VITAMMIQRTIQKSIESNLFQGKAILILGPRQAGKTTLVQSILAQKEHLFLNADDPSVRQLLHQADTFRLRQIIGNQSIVFIDEAQRIPEIGMTLKLITDQFKSVQLIVTGSSALELSSQTSEPLTGRKLTFRLLPISWHELENAIGYVQAEAQLEHRLISGLYPDVINHPGKESLILSELSESYPYKDILAMAAIRKPELLERLLQALALQLGSEVSYNELAQLLQVDKVTVVNYIDLLEKAFIVFRLRSFSRNLRNEIKNNRKIYFWDTGIRNTLIANYNPLNLRQDKGALWENFLVSERMKQIHYHHRVVNCFFWRTTQQQEIDFIEERDGVIHGFEFKFTGKPRARIPENFKRAYGDQLKVISRMNFREFVMPG